MVVAIGGSEQSKMKRGKRAARVVHESTRRVRQNASELRRLTNQTWDCAVRAPIFCDITHTADKARYWTRRAIRLRSTFDIAASGAAMRATKVVERRCAALHLLAPSEKNRAPWKPTVTNGARIVLDNFIRDVVWEATRRANAARRAAGKRVRLNGAHMRLGFKQTRAIVFEPSCLMTKVPIYHASKKTEDALGGAHGTVQSTARRSKANAAKAKPTAAA